MLLTVNWLPSESVENLQMSCVGFSSFTRCQCAQARPDDVGCLQMYFPGHVFAPISPCPAFATLQTSFCAPFVNSGPLSKSAGIPAATTSSLEFLDNVLFFAVSKNLELLPPQTLWTESKLISLDVQKE